MRKRTIGAHLPVTPLELDTLEESTPKLVSSSSYLHLFRDDWHSGRSDPCLRNMLLLWETERITRTDTKERC